MALSFVNLSLVNDHRTTIHPFTTESPQIFADNSPGIGLLVLLLAIGFAAFLVCCGIFIAATLIASCVRSRKVSNAMNCPDSFIYSTYMKDDQVLIKRYNEIKLSPPGLLGSLNDFYLKPAVSNSSVKIEPLERIRPTSPLRHLTVSVVAEKSKNAPQIPRRVSSLYKAGGFVLEPKQAQASLVDMGYSHM